MCLSISASHVRKLSSYIWLRLDLLVRTKGGRWWRSGRACQTTQSLSEWSVHQHPLLRLPATAASYAPLSLSLSISLGANTLAGMCARANSPSSSSRSVTSLSVPEYEGIHSTLKQQQKYRTNAGGAIEIYSASARRASCPNVTQTTCYLPTTTSDRLPTRHGQHKTHTHTPNVNLDRFLKLL
jgi:hypothetical protein